MQIISSVKNVKEDERKKIGGGVPQHLLSCLPVA